MKPFKWTDSVGDKGEAHVGGPGVAVALTLTQGDREAIVFLNVAQAKGLRKFLKKALEAQS
jgi:hypothetical protein